MICKLPRIVLGVVVATVVALPLQMAVAAKKKGGGTWIDPDKARKEDPDFSIQGEYGSEKKGAAYGAQVVALGDGKFDAYVLEGGLPGLGWDKSKKRIRARGKREGDEIRLAAPKEKLTAVIRGGRIVVKQGGRTVADLPRIERESPTLNAKPAKGAVVLFDGTSAEQWHRGRIADGNLMSGTTSKGKFGSYTLHLEFRNTYKPHARGQGRSNSGVYHQSRYETQVLDSFGLEGRMNEAGGIYSIAAPRINMCLPPLTWQTYDVDFTTAQYDGNGKKTKHARITVRLNGTVIHEDQELGHRTTASPLREGPEPGPIHLQAHGNKVVYRNIWIIKK